MIRPLGRGGMAEVYLARDRELGRKVALKVIRREALGSGELVARFMFEARTTARFNHPHIVTVYAVTEDEGSPVISLEYVEGHTLRTRLESGKVGSREALRIAHDVCDALVEAHRHGVLHRDLKPENVMFGLDGRLRVLDFGLAKLLSVPEDADVTASMASTTLRPNLETQGGLRGTPAYMAPEQWDGRPATPASDIWAFGVLLYELLLGHRPYEQGSMVELAVRICADDPVPLPASLAPGLPELLSACLDKDPARRPAAGDVLQTLDRPPLAQGVTNLEPEAGPFRGLLPFEEGHAANFFGRDEEVVQVVERLRTSPFLAVVGASGAGKSSFVMAGVVPRLRELGPTEIVRIRPGRRPFEVLANHMDAARRGSTNSSPLGVLPTSTPGAAPAALAVRLAEQPARLGALLQEVAVARACTVVLIVDQLEEIFTQTADPEVMKAFLRGLAQAADDPSAPVRVLVTLREEFLSRAAQVPAMRVALRDIVLLLPPNGASLRELLRRMVRGAGFDFDPPSLVERMVDEVDGEASSLPLLQFAGQQLWKRRDPQQRRLTAEAYEEIGGVAGALAGHAEAALAGLHAEELAHARTALLRLLTPEGTRRAMTRRRLLDGLGGGAEEVVRVLLQARLLVERHAEDSDEPELELAHESLATAWTRLRRWRIESQEDLARLAELEHVAQVWARRGAREEETWQGEAQRDAERAIAHTSMPVPAAVSRFVEAGRGRAARSYRRRRWLRGLTGLSLIAITACAVIVALVLADKEAAAEQARLHAKVALSRALVEAAQRSVDSLRFGEAEAYAAEALVENPGYARSPIHDPDYAAAHPDSAHVAADAISVLYRLESLPRAGLEARCIECSPAASQMVFSSGGRWLLEYGYPWTGLLRKRVVPRILDARTGRSVLELPTDFGTAAPALFLPGDRHALVAAEDAFARVFDLEGRRVLRDLPGPDGAARAKAFARGPSGELAIADQRGAVHFFGPDWVPRDPPLVHRAPVVSLAYDDAGHLLTATEGGLVQRWRGRTLVAEHRSELRGSVRVVPGPSTVLVVWPRQSVLHLSQDELRPVWPTETKALPAREAKFDPARERLAVLENSERIVLYRLEDRTVDVFAPSDDLYAFAFVPDRPMLATNGKGWSTALVDLRTLELRARFPATENLLVRMAFSPDGRHFAVGDASGRVRIQSWSAGALAPDLPPERCTALGASPDGLVLAGGSNRARAITLWDVVSGRPLRTLPNPGEWVASLSFSADGRRLASVDYDRPVQLWDLQTGRSTTGAARSQIFSDLRPDGRKLAFQRGGQPFVKDLDTGLEVKAPQVGGGRVGFSPDGKILAFGSREGARPVVLWSFEEGDRVRSLAFDGVERASAVGFSPDGTRLAAVSYTGRVQLWTLPEGQTQWVDKQARWINTVRFSPDGRLLVTAGDDMTATIYDVATGARRLRVQMPSGVNDAVFLDGGRRLAVCHAGGVRMLPLRLDALAIDPVARLAQARRALDTLGGAPDSQAPPDAGVR